MNLAKHEPCPRHSAPDHIAANELTLKDPFLSESCIEIKIGDQKEKFLKALLTFPFIP